MTSPARSSRASRRGRALVCALVGAVLASAGAAPLAAQGTTPVVSVTLPADEPLRSVTPTFVVSTQGFGVTDMLPTRLQIDTTSRFTGPFLLDTTVLARGGAAGIAPTRALPENVHIYVRATVTDPATGRQFASPITGTRTTPPWVTLVTPPVAIAQPVRTRTPRFIWHSPQVNEPPGPWNYTITIKNLGQTSLVSNVGSDTSFVPASNLELNAVYTWSVQATLPRSGQASVVQSSLTFVVEDSTQAVAITDLYPAFPSPFPGITKDATCIWFDLKNPSTVQLDVYDLRGVHVRRLVPNGQILGTLPSGRYGRGRTATNEGCDPLFEWDGTDDAGRFVPEGVYLVRFRGDGVQRIRKVIFRGRR